MSERTEVTFVVDQPSHSEAHYRAYLKGANETDRFGNVTGMVNYGLGDTEMKAIERAARTIARRNMAEQTMKDVALAGARLDDRDGEIFARAYAAFRTNRHDPDTEETIAYVVGDVLDEHPDLDPEDVGELARAMRALLNVGDDDWLRLVEQRMRERYRTQLSLVGVKS